MTRDRRKEKAVVIFRSAKLFEVEALAQELGAAEINCAIEGRPTAGVFAGLSTLDGVTMMNLVVLEGDEAAAKEIVKEWLAEEGPEGDGESG